ncbi:hypothetical protein ACFSJQ_18295 [Vibrio olivae]|uniref:Uncharacterized protein n=1 Tax=Vibrio olivae TaxID=1243002 RepID=A0ABV5HP91_9VIBR
MMFGYSSRNVFAVFLACGLFITYVWQVLIQFGDEIDLLTIKQESPHVSAAQFNDMLESENPVLLVYSASAYSLAGYQYLQSEKSDIARQFFSFANQLAAKASWLKPMDGNGYLQRANYAWIAGEEPKVIGSYIAQLQQVEPYETTTVFESLKYYFHFWPEISGAERKQAIEYLYNPGHYGVNYTLIGRNITEPTSRLRVCQIYAFTDKKVGFCVKEFGHLYSW